MSGLLIDFENDFADLLTTHSGERFGATTKSASGRAVSGSKTGFNFRGSYPQPARANDLKMLPEGSTLSSSIVVHSVDKIQLSTMGNAGDVMIWEGDRYRAVQQNIRDPLAGNYRTLFVKIQAGEE